VAIADLNIEAAQTLAAHCGIPKVTASAEEIIADPAIEAVLICSSTEHARRSYR
jgi:myo-inositol 2-dehydrogenase/D-chiro-inositol 1-dehydrogenase